MFIWQTACAVCRKSLRPRFRQALRATSSAPMSRLQFAATGFAEVAQYRSISSPSFLRLRGISTSCGSNCSFSQVRPNRRPRLRKISRSLVAVAAPVAHLLLLARALLENRSARIAEIGSVLPQAIFNPRGVGNVTAAKSEGIGCAGGPLLGSPFVVLSKSGSAIQRRLNFEVMSDHSSG